MNTNDPQAPYGDKTAEREPMLSDEEISREKPLLIMIKLEGGTIDPADVVMMPMNQFQVRDFYESKITSGELRVVKKARILSDAGYDEWYQPPNVCSDCGFTWMCPGDDEGRPTSKLCPNCGADLTQ